MLGLTRKRGAVGAGTGFCLPPQPRLRTFDKLALRRPNFTADYLLQGKADFSTAEDFSPLQN